MKLKNSIQITGLYTGTSKFPFWKNLKIGDIVELSIELESHRSHRGLYATNVSIKNLTQKQSFSSSIADTARYLSKLKYAEPDMTSEVIKEMNRVLEEIVLYASDPEEFRVKYLGPNGAVKKTMGLIVKVASEAKKDVAALLNYLKNVAEKKYESLK